MKRMIKDSLYALAGMVLQSAAQAAPIIYRLDSTYHLYETQYLADGGSIALDTGKFLIPAIKPSVSITFTYDSNVPLTPIAAPPSDAHVTYLDAFNASGALTNVAGSIGDWHFDASSTNTMLMSYIQLDVAPGTTVRTNFGMIGPVTGNGASFSGTLDGKLYTLTQMSLSLGIYGFGGSLPSTLGERSFDGGSVLQFLLNADDGSSVVASFYLPTLTQVPVPSAAWLLGSGLLGLAGVARRGRK